MVLTKKTTFAALTSFICSILFTNMYLHWDSVQEKYTEMKRYVAASQVSVSEYATLNTNMSVHLDQDLPYILTVAVNIPSNSSLLLLNKSHSAYLTYTSFNDQWNVTSPETRLVAYGDGRMVNQEVPPLDSIKLIAGKSTLALQFSTEDDMLATNNVISSIFAWAEVISQAENEKSRLEKLANDALKYNK